MILYVDDFIVKVKAKMNTKYAKNLIKCSLQTFCTWQLSVLQELHFSQ